MKAHHVQQVLALESHLDRHDALLRRSQAAYKTFATDRIEELEYQTNLVKQAVAARSQWTAELATGCGKSVIAARIAADKLADGPVVYISPSAASIGDTENGVINKFERVLRDFAGRGPWLGRLNELSPANDVSFMTPRVLVTHMRNDPMLTKRLLRQAACVIVDEAHHFPDDPEEDLAIFGELHRMARQHVQDGLVVALTGTWHRLDRKRPMGVVVPDARFTVQDAVNLGRCPEIYGVQVVTDIRAKKATHAGGLYDFHLVGEERIAYLKGVVDCMETTWRRYPVPFAAFTRTVSDAVAIASRFNAQVGRTEANGVVVLTAQTHVSKRLEIIRAISEGRLLGFVTCGVGEEAIDIPALEVIHLVRRTRSFARNQQAIGRALRTLQGKRRALVIDYQTILEGLRDRFVGLSCDDMLEPLGSDLGAEQTVNGGPLVAQHTYPIGELVGMSMAEERAIVCIDRTPAAKKKAELLRLAGSGADRPSAETPLGRALSNYTAPKSHCRDAQFAEKIFGIRPDWRNPDNEARWKKKTLLELAHAQAPRPLKHHTLGKALQRYTNPGRSFDAAFDTEIRAAAPAWFVRLTRATFRENMLKMAPQIDKPTGLEWGRVENHCRAHPEFKEALQKLRPEWFKPRNEEATRAKQELLRQARTGEPRPEGRQAELLLRYARRTSSTSYDEEFAKEIRTARPDWFLSSEQRTKDELRALAREGAPRPSPNYSRKLYWKYWNYITKGQPGYDAAFQKEIWEMRPDWRVERRSQEQRKGRSRAPVVATGAWNCPCACSSYTEHRKRAMTEAA